MKYCLTTLLLLVLVNACNQTKPPFDGKTAWREFEQTMLENYAYLEPQRVDAKALFSHFELQAKDLKKEAEFIDLIQVVLRYFIDPHLNISPLNKFDYSVIPTGSDIWAKWDGNSYVIEDIKAGSAASLAGLTTGLKIISIDGKSVDETIQNVFACSTFPQTVEHKLWAINIALGGLRNSKRIVRVLEQSGNEVSFTMKSSYAWLNTSKDEDKITAKRIGDLGYIRFNNSLGSDETVKEFKDKMIAFQDTKGLIIDMRNTPSGGNTGVAEPIMGHFVREKTVYQRYQYQKPGQIYQKSKMRDATTKPASPFYDKPYVVLCGRWTGSMGEGMTIGFDAIGAKNVIGAPMADLLGGTKGFELNNCGANISIGYERLFHVNGSYREDFIPSTPVIPADSSTDGSDPALLAAVNRLNE